MGERLHQKQTPPCLRHDGNGWPEGALPYEDTKRKEEKMQEHDTGRP
jgi:hypothetical protein